jgi:hypothetical protein
MVSQRTRFNYDIGEEVVVRLHHGSLFDLERAAPLPASCMPSWTIGTVAGRRRRLPGDCERYVVRFRRHGRPCIAIVDSADIEGTA